MNNIKAFLEFLSFSENIYVFENFDIFECKFKSHLTQKIESKDLENFLEFISKRDYLILSLTVNSSEPLQLDSREYDVLSFSQQSSELFKHLSEEEKDVIFEIKIYKNILENTISVYVLSIFIDFLNKLSFLVLLNEFSKLFTYSNCLVIQLLYDKAYLRTETILVTNEPKEFPISRQIGSDIIGNAKSSCHFTPISKYNFIPSDFYVQESDNELIKKIFSKICIIYSIGFIFDILDVPTPGISSYRLNGYKTIKGDIDLEKLNVNSNLQYYNIYAWIYGTGTFIDKLGLARNIISLHINGTNNIDIIGDPILAIQSSYKVYEKQNIKQYIEIRNKISDQLVSFHERANKLVESVSSAFQKNSLALLSFYLTTIIFRILKNDNLINVFTIDAALLSTVFIICSVGYYYALEIEVNMQIERFERHYANIKDRYKDLLDNQDLSRILNNDREFNQDLIFINRKISVYKGLWLFELLVFLIGTWSIYFIYN